MFRLLRVAVFLVCGLSIAAHADPVTFSFDNVTFGSGATLTGTTVIDTATGQLISADVVYALGAGSVAINGPYALQIVLPAGPYGLLYDLTVADLPEGGIDLTTVNLFEPLIPALSLVGYHGGPLCSGAYYCGGGLFSAYFGRTDFLGVDFLSSGSLVPATTTPEPSPVILLGSAFAIFCILFLSRRRMIVLHGTA